MYWTCAIGSTKSSPNEHPIRANRLGGIHHGRGLLSPTDQKEMSPTIGLIAVTSVDIEAHAHALRHSQKEMEKAGIKVSDVCLVTHQPPWDRSGLRLVQLSHAIDILSYARFQVRKLHQVIETDFILNIQADGFVTNASKWTDDFLKYDYIGAPWKSPQGKNGARVGNSGFSLRSAQWHRFSSLPYAGIENDEGFVYYDDQGDDIYWTQFNHRWMKKQWLDVYDRFLTIAPLELALQFSLEQDCPEAPGRTIHDCFGQHARGKITPQ